LGNNTECPEGVANPPDLGGTGYYDCGLWGSYLVMEKSFTTGLFQIMEIKAWSWDHLNQHADPLLVTSSNGPDNFPHIAE